MRTGQSMKCAPPRPHQGGTRQGGFLPGPGGFLGPRRVCNRPFQENSSLLGGRIPTSPPTAQPAAGCRGHCRAGLHSEGSSPQPADEDSEGQSSPQSCRFTPTTTPKCHQAPPQRTKPRLRQTHCSRSLSCKGPNGHPDEAQDGCPRRATQPARGFPRLLGGVPPPSSDKAAPPARYPLPTPPLQGGVRRNLVFSKEEVSPTRLSHRIQCSSL